MIDALGVMGWGVGGIEAEAVMLGQPYYMSIPQVIGVEFDGRLAAGDHRHRPGADGHRDAAEYGVVEKFVEYFGPGLKQLTVPDRATISNMTPEYGATLGFFPVDEKTIEYLRCHQPGRPGRAGGSLHPCKRSFLHRRRNAEYTDVLDFDLATVNPASRARRDPRTASSDGSEIKIRRHPGM